MDVKRRIPVAAALAVALAAQATPALAAPPNDDFASAYTLTGTSDAQAYTTSGATFQADEPDTDGAKHTVWFKWKPTTSGNVRLQGAGFEKDVWKGSSIDWLNSVPLWADSNWTPYFAAKAGEQYYIRVDDEGTARTATLALQQDTTMPQTTLLVAEDVVPSRPSTDHFKFASSEGFPPGYTDGKYACTLDGVATPCRRFGGWWSTDDPLPGGEHTMTVAAVDPFFNVDPTPASHTFVVDTTPPETTITSTPPSVADDTGYTIPISFTSSEPGSTFECKGHQMPDFFDCTSVWDVHLGNGPVWVEVRATDPQGNVDPTPARLAWTRDLAETQRIQAQRARDATHPPGTTPGAGDPSTWTGTGASADPLAEYRKPCRQELLPFGRLTRRALLAGRVTFRARTLGGSCSADVRLVVGGKLIWREGIGLFPGQGAASRTVRLNAAARRAIRRLRRGARMTVAVPAVGAPTLRRVVRLG